MQSNKLNEDLMRISLAVAILCLLVVGARMRGQEKADLTVRVKVVNVPATVRDKHGKIVTNLTKDDFVLEEDGRPQTLHYFSQESSLPLTLGLLVDTSMSQRRVLGQERTASSSFIDQMLRPEKDKAFLIHFDHEVELDQDLTASQEKLRSALDSLQTPQFTQTSGGNQQGQSPSGYPGRRSGGHRDGNNRGGGTLLYDAVYLASDELMKKQSGRKALIVLSDGDDRGSKETLRTAIETAQRADTIIYSILFKDDEDRSFGGGFGGIGMGGHHGGPGGGRGRYPQEPRVDGKKILDQMSRETGGRLFEVSGKQTVEKIYAQIEEDLRNQYSLGYTPDRNDPGEGFHKISVKTKQKDLVVHAREEYYWGQ
ncbi:MAG TPA: VWA domain-containing protein [Candidatus Binatia bacterium]|nr:VWA domain-containing protein [Candidatus Binatia bacterium]